MSTINKLQNDTQQYIDIKYSLKTVITQRQIALEQIQRQKSVAQKQVKTLASRVAQAQNQLVFQKNKNHQSTNNFSIAVKDLQYQCEQLKQQKHQIQFQLNVSKMKNQEETRQHAMQILKIKKQYQSQKDILNQKIIKLQKNIDTLNKQFHVQQAIHEDKHKIIEDANRNLKGFANEKQQRMIIIQNQQYNNEIQYQSRQITGLLQKNQRLIQEIRQYKIDIQLHKNISNDLVRRSSLAHNLIKQLNNRIKQLEKLIQKDTDKDKEKEQLACSCVDRESRRSQKNNKSHSNHQSNASQNENQQIRQLEQMVAKLKYDNANLKNYTTFLETTQKNNNKKYENLGQIMAQYLQMLYNSHKNQQQLQNIQNVININLMEIKNKNIKQWKFRQIQIILNLLITQIKPFISKQSLTTFPEVKNIKVSFIQDQVKQPLSLPKIIQEYQKNQQKDSKGNRFKDVPVDISTKILRSNLREWGAKVHYGSGSQKKHKQASKSIVMQGQKIMI